MLLLLLFSFCLGGYLGFLQLEFLELKKKVASLTEECANLRYELDYAGRFIYDLRS